MILEKVVAIQVERYFEQNGLLGTFQFGFRKHRSTISELLQLFDNILEAKDKRQEIMLVMYDLSAAFDTISHDTFLKKMEIYGFQEKAFPPFSPETYMVLDVLTTTSSFVFLDK